MNHQKIYPKAAIGFGIAVLYGVLCLVAFASAASRTEKPAAVDAEQYADFKYEPEPEDNHYLQWTEACKGQGTTVTPFAYAGPMTETVLLGNLAVRLQQPIEWDSAALTAKGLPAADIQVIRRGKALEYFSRHYGKVYVDEGRAISVKDALVGINQLIDEDADKGKEAPPVTAEPMTRQFLRTFDGKAEIARHDPQHLSRRTIRRPGPPEVAWRGEPTLARAGGRRLL